MAINAYIGIPGSGKSYEVVSSVILPAFLSGRRVVTNVEGVSQDKFLDYVDKLNEKRKKNNLIDVSLLGEIIKVSDNDVLKVNFFPYKNSSDNNTIANKGDLICIDEVWRIFDDSKKILEEHKSFIAEHRHFVNSNGNTCDLVIISQSLSNIPRFIKDRIETVYRMTKLKSLGLNSRYKIEVFSGNKLYKVNKLHTIQGKYNKDIFNLYSSYDNSNAKESRIDDRDNILKNKFFIFKMSLSVFFVIFAIFKVLSFFDVEDKKNTKPISKNVIENETLTTDSIDRVSKIKRNRKDVANDKIKNIDDFQDSETWRIIGTLNNKSGDFVILSNGAYNRYEPRSKFVGNNFNLVGVIDNKKVSFYSGSKNYNSSSSFDIFGGSNDKSK